MDNLDYLFEQKSEAAPKEFDVESWKAAKNGRREAAYAQVSDTAEIITSDTDKLRDVLNIMARLPRYSVNNCLLIAAQMPTATQLKTYDKWLDAKAPVKRGAKGITILEPGGEYVRRDGTTAVNIDAKTVFDISQTHSTIKTPTTTTTARNGALLVKAVMYQAVVPVILGDAGSTEYSAAESVVKVSKGQPFEPLFRSLASALADAELSQGIDGKTYAPESTFAPAAAAYILCKRFGVDAASIDLSAAQASLRGMSPVQIKNELTGAMAGANALTDKMRTYIAQQRAIDKEKVNDSVER